MKRDHSTSECGACGVSDCCLLHTIRHRASYRLLCSNCVLKNQPGLFCPICLQVYDDAPPPPPQRLLCLKCPSISHLSCSPLSSSTFLCPPCSNPSFSFLNLSPVPKAPKSTPDASPHIDRFIDKDSAKALLAAAKIAAISMTKAATLARVEAERKVKEAAFAKRRAKEALERLSLLAARQTLKKDNDRYLKGLAGAAAADPKRSDKGSNGLLSVSPVNPSK